MHLVVDATVALQDLEKTLVTPGVVPRVDTEPVVLTVLSTPANRLDGVTSELLASGVAVDTRLVGREVLVDGEGRGDGTVLLDLSLDVLDTIDGVAAVSGVLVVGVGAVLVIDASLGASGRDLLNIVT